MCCDRNQSPATTRNTGPRILCQFEFNHLILLSRVLPAVDINQHATLHNSNYSTDIQSISMA
jgi:hypothetical protein